MTDLQGGVNPLEQYFRDNEGRAMFKWRHYFDIYHRHFERYRGRPVTVVEFGVAQGGSLQMWKSYFGPDARVCGVDVDPRCKTLEEDQIEIFIGDQADRSFLSHLREQIGEADIVIDDGGHHMDQQIATFEEMFPLVVSGGAFLVEDVHTSYWRQFGGGYRKKGTFVEYAKGLIDRLHAWHSESGELKADYYTRHIKAMHVYGSVMVFDKAEVVEPVHQRTGRQSFKRGRRLFRRVRRRRSRLSRLPALRRR